jgi:class 3 adenylate cyclase
MGGGPILELRGYDRLPDDLLGGVVADDPVPGRWPRDGADPAALLIVDDTERAAELGDRRWTDLLQRHHALLRHDLARFRGHEIDTAGDGFLATFDGPARAIRCARAITEAVRPLGIEVRAGRAEAYNYIGYMYAEKVLTWTRLSR